MKTLRFLNPDIQEGLNLTVRNGSKWADLKCGEALRVVKTGEEDTELGRVVVINAVRRSVLDGLPSDLLRYEHDPSCRSPEGLRKALDEAYPDGWGPDLTLLFFVPLGGSQ